MGVTQACYQGILWIVDKAAKREKKKTKQHVFTLESLVETGPHVITQLYPSPITHLGYLFGFYSEMQPDMSVKRNAA